MDRSRSDVAEGVGPRSGRLWARTRSVGATALLAVLAASSCELIELPALPDSLAIVIDSPVAYQIVTSHPFDIAGKFEGPVETVTVKIDALPEAHALPDSKAGFWRYTLPADLPAGIHRAVVEARGDAGVVRDFRWFATGSEPYLVAFLPERRVMESFLTFHELGIFAPASTGVPVRLTLEDADGLTVSAGDELPADGSLGVEIPHSPTSELVEITADDDTVRGEHLVVVRADGPPGTEPVRATLIVNVRIGVPPTVAPPSPTPVASAPSLHVEAYDVTRIITASDVGGVGSRTRIVWTLAFACPDGRCDAEVDIDGPAGGFLPLLASYDAQRETFTIDAVTVPTNPDCPAQAWSGKLVATAWDSRGPVAFDYRLTQTLRCSFGESSVSYAGTGRRR